MNDTARGHQECHKLCLCPLPASACWLTTCVDPPQGDRHAIIHRRMTLLKVTSTYSFCAWHSQTWPPPVATLKNWGNLYRKLPEQTFPPHPWQKQGYMPTCELSTGLENGLPMIRLISFYPWVRNWMEFSGDTATWKSVHSWEKKSDSTSKKVGKGGKESRGGCEDQFGVCRLQCLIK